MIPSSLLFIFSPPYSFARWLLPFISLHCSICVSHRQNVWCVCTFVCVDTAVLPTVSSWTATETDSSCSTLSCLFLFLLCYIFQIVYLLFIMHFLSFFLLQYTFYIHIDIYSHLTLVFSFSLILFTLNICSTDILHKAWQLISINRMDTFITAFTWPLLSRTTQSADQMRICIVPLSKQTVISPPGGSRHWYLCLPPAWPTCWGLLGLLRATSLMQWLINTPKRLHFNTLLHFLPKSKFIVLSFVETWQTSAILPLLNEMPWGEELN